MCQRINRSGSIVKKITHFVLFLVFTLLSACQKAPPQEVGTVQSTPQQTEAAPSTSQETEAVQSTPQETAAVLIENVGLAAAFDFKMADRFGLDRNRNNIPDLPNTIEYVQNIGDYRADLSNSCLTVESYRPTFTVYFNATESASLSTMNIDQYRWNISGNDIPELNLEGAEPCANLPEQVYSVTLTVTAGEYGASVEKEVLVEDLLFVSIGDSYSSGEGNPEKSNAGADWADPGPDNDPVGDEHIISHRSTLAWPAQAALALELADPHTSVTFVSVAATGATIDEGLINPYGGAKEIEQMYSVKDMAPQIVQVKELVVDRPIDIMTISIGINDIGFSNIATSLMIKGAYVGGTTLPHITYGSLLQAIESGGWKELLRESSDTDWVGEMLARRVPWERLAGLSGLPSEFIRLKEFVTETGLNENIRDNDIYVVQYPDPTTRLHESRGLMWCREMMAHFGIKPELIGARLWMYEIFCQQQAQGHPLVRSSF